MVKGAGPCSACRKSCLIIQKKISSKKQWAEKPLLLNSPLLKASKEQLCNVVNVLQSKERLLKERISQLEKEMDKKAVVVDNEWHKDPNQIITGAENTFGNDSFEKLFWE